ncbi:MAG: hypothetical protein A4E49_02657 [Methanosaeta sp. PtaU1.Bin112]|nr:MAG: hypothetical protein A4E49_02657 [Methanosaeta sp. PtaU1.Bin112]
MEIKFFIKCGITLLIFSIVLALFCIAGCLERPSELPKAPVVSADLRADLPPEMDFDSELRGDLFCVRGNIMLPGNSSLAYVLFNATLCQGSVVQFDTKYLLIEPHPGEENSFEIAKNVKIPEGEYTCILEAEGPQGLLARESRVVSLVSEQKHAFELIPWPEDLDPDNKLSSREDEKAQSDEESAVQNRQSEKDPQEKSPGAVTGEEKEPESGEKSLQASSSQEAEGKFVGSITSKKYHRPDCRYALKIKADNRIYFLSGEDAEEQGYLPCKVCSP